MSDKQAKNQAKDQKQRKIFVGGIPKDVTEKSLKKYFSKFGQVVRTVVNREHYTDKSRGSGFVLFKSSKSATLVLQQESHVLNGKSFDCQPCLLREEVQKTKKEKRLKNLDSSSTQCSQKSRNAQDNSSIKKKSRKQSRKGTNHPHYQQPFYPQEQSYNQFPHPSNHNRKRNSVHSMSYRPPSYDNFNGNFEMPPFKKSNQRQNQYPEAGYDHGYDFNTPCSNSQGSYENLPMFYDQYDYNQVNRPQPMSYQNRNYSPDYSLDSSFSGEYHNPCYTKQPQPYQQNQPCHTQRNYPAQKFNSEAQYSHQPRNQPMLYPKMNGPSPDRTDTPIPMSFNPMSDHYQHHVKSQSYSEFDM